MSPDYHAWTHRPKAQGGTDPIQFPGATSSAYLDTWLANGTGASIPNNVWRSVCNGGAGGANSRWFDVFAKDPDGGWSVDFDSGFIDHSPTDYVFSAWGFVQFDVVNGTLIGVELDPMDGAFNVSHAVDSAPFVCVYAERFPMPTGGIALRCYQASGAAADLVQARLHVRRFEQATDYEFSTAT